MLLFFFETPLILLKTYFARRVWSTQLRCSLYPSSSEIISVACRLAAHYHWQRAAIRYRFFSLRCHDCGWSEMSKIDFDGNYTHCKSRKISVGRHFLLKLSSRVGICTSANFTQKKKKQFRFTSSSKWQSAMRRDDGNQLTSFSIKYPFYFSFDTKYLLENWSILSFHKCNTIRMSTCSLFSPRNEIKRKFESNRLGHGVEYWVPALEFGHCTLHARTLRSPMCDRVVAREKKTEIQLVHNVKNLIYTFPCWGEIYLLVCNWYQFSTSEQIIAFILDSCQCCAVQLLCVDWRFHTPHRLTMCASLSTSFVWKTHRRPHTHSIFWILIEW